MSRLHSVVSPLALSALASAASAQSINIDFGGSAGTPPSTYGAAGPAGTWNDISLLLEPGSASRPFPLVDLDGAATAVTLVVDTAYGTLDYPHDETAGDVAALMDDALFALSPDIAMYLIIGGLGPGTYRIYTYTWDWPTEQIGMVAQVGDSPVIQPVGGPWTGGLELGVTHMVHFIDHAGGTLEIQLVAGGPGGFFNGSGVINGLQIERLEGLACDADLNRDGGVDGADLGALLAGWGGTGPGDLDGSGAIDGADLGVLLAGWGACPGCGAGDCPARRGDCYEQHDTPGCTQDTCCAAICQADPFCCEHQWDAVCVGLANLATACPDGNHPHCGNAIGGSCFVARDSFPGCDRAECCDAICNVDAYCCTFAWDVLCADQAIAMCER